ncbi:hypothetical protein JX580_04615 [Thiomicrospira microaerophila]|uniref:hypothetical protein n=1 Tax=Thiomicrospira microaerophila TaxID=406020 RepID=UPI00200C5DC9|nr:hypothetical protein [Thiomicrospira microaerophila]UQB43164.1 hypothetical protein JX580_04615 [Thiomicrospira microaerophila]
MNWFEDLTGFAETNYADTQAQLLIEEQSLVCTPADSDIPRRYQAGQLLMPTLAELRQQTASLNIAPKPNRVREWVGDVQQLHLDPANQNAVFQVASQFNLLEMVSPFVTPLEGVTGYAFDKTQGPACAIACAAGTIYRNYLVEIKAQHGQTETRQLNMLDELEQVINNPIHQYWQMQNGYLMPTQQGLEELKALLNQASPAVVDVFKSKIKVGVQQDTQVTLNQAKHHVTQVYCSALPIAYHPFMADDWTPFAQLVLDAAYEATFHVALHNAQRTGNSTLYLSLLGGGAFGNPTDWILDAIDKSLVRFENRGLDILFVSYGSANPTLTPWLNPV